jgi:hypothetical protein
MGDGRKYAYHYYRPGMQRAEESGEQRVNNFPGM